MVIEYFIMYALHTMQYMESIQFLNNIESFSWKFFKSVSHLKKTKNGYGYRVLFVPLMSMKGSLRDLSMKDDFNCSFHECENSRFQEIFILRLLTLRTTVF